MEEVLFKSERRLARAEVADLLRDVANKLEAGDAVTLSVGDESVTLDPPARPTFEVKAEREVEGNETELSLELEIEWDERESGADGREGGLEVS